VNQQAGCRVCGKRRVEGPRWRVCSEACLATLIRTYWPRWGFVAEVGFEDGYARLRAVYRDPGDRLAAVSPCIRLQVGVAPPSPASAGQAPGGGICQELSAVVGDQ